MAKKEAAKAELMVVNTAYFLTEANLVPDPITSGRELVIVDEADVLESELMNFATFEVSETVCDPVDVLFDGRDHVGADRRAARAGDGEEVRKP